MNKMGSGSCGENEEVHSDWRGGIWSGTTAFLLPEMPNRNWIQVWEMGAGLLYQVTLAAITDATSNLRGLTQ